MEQQFCCCLNLKTVTAWTESDERQKVDSVACPTADFGEDRTCEEKLCQHECTELDGTGFICSCRPGYEVNPDSTFSCLGTPAAPQELQSDKIQKLSDCLSFSLSLFARSQTSTSATSTASVLRSAGTSRAATTASAPPATVGSETAKCARPKVRMAPRAEL